jgi:hypothetical protein
LNSEVLLKGGFSTVDLVKISSFLLDCAFPDFSQLTQKNLKKQKHFNPKNIKTIDPTGETTNHGEVEDWTNGNGYFCLRSCSGTNIIKLFGKTSHFDNCHYICRYLVYRISI